MGTVIELGENRSRGAGRRQTPDVPGDVILFTGVRYERGAGWSEAVPPKPEPNDSPPARGRRRHGRA